MLQTSLYSNSVHTRTYNKNAVRIAGELFLRYRKNSHYVHYVVFYSQNKELWSACESSNVSKAKELLARGAHVNYHNPDRYNVSTVSGHMT